jgi:hypothetical protein
MSSITHSDRLSDSDSAHLNMVTVRCARRQNWNDNARYKSNSNKSPKNSPPVGSELSDSTLFAYPVAQEGAQDVDNQKEWEVANTLGQSGGRRKIGGSYI